MEKKQTKDTLEKQALLRTELILKVRGGKMTASEAAKQLNVSRKTYYQWEKRALEAMMSSLRDRDAGRPKTSEEKRKIAQLQGKLKEKDGQIDFLERKIELKEIIDNFFRSADPFGSKKK